MHKLSSGKRNLLVNDIPAAVAALAESCQLLGQHFGETAVECGEAYFYYGKGLLELARLENGVLENVMDGGKKFDRWILSLWNIDVEWDDLMDARTELLFSFLNRITLGWSSIILLFGA